ISYLGYQNSFGGGSGDGFLVKFDASGNRLWATYYGNNGDDRVRGLCLDNAGNVYLSGFTTSISGIASGGGFQNSYGGGTGDAFLVKFDANGNRIWSTYYGGTNDESGYGVTTDAAGNVYLTGESVSTNGISYLGFQNMNGGSYDAFLVKFDANGNRIWATYYGGTGAEFAFDAVTDAGGNVYLVGETSSATAIASGGFQNTYGGAYDGFLVKFNASGARQWATYYGGSPSDCISGVCIDNAGRIYCSGQTGSTSGIASGGFQTTFGGGAFDNFLVKFDGSGSRIWSTYYGGPGDENQDNSCETDGSGNIYLSSITPSTSGIASGGFQNIYGGGTSDAYLVRFDSLGNRLAATYYGGSGSDMGYGLCTNSLGNVYWGGITSSTTSIASGGFQNTYGGGSYDAFLVKLTNCSNVPSSPGSISGLTTVCSGSTNTYSINAVPGATSYTWILPGGWSGTSATTSITATAGTTGGTISVTANNACGSSPTQTLTVTVPSVTYNETQTGMCVNWPPQTLTPGIPGGGTYSGTAVTGNTFDPAAAGAGSFYIVYTFTDINGCTNADSSLITVGLCTGTGQVTDNSEQLFLYPNPFSNTFVIVTQGECQVMTLFNVLGEDLGRWILKQGENSIDLHQLETGIYFIEVRSGNQMITRKIIKE
ncbi:MAG TPA: SBBP repeat-containing protein, partial [Bacteroidia bacterium]